MLFPSLFRSLKVIHQANLSKTKISLNKQFVCTLLSSVSIVAQNLSMKLKSQSVTDNATIISIFDSIIEKLSLDF